MTLQVIQTHASLAEHRGGLPRTVVALSEALAERPGLVVDLVTGNRDDDGTRLVPDPLRVANRPMPARRRGGAVTHDFAAGIDAALASRRAAATIVHDNGLWSPANFAVATAARKRRLPYVVSPHGMLQPVALAHHGLRKRVAWQLYQRRILGQSVGLMATAESELTAIRAVMPRLPVAVIPNGIAVPETLLPRPHVAPRRVLFMSRLLPIKNLNGLIDAWQQVCADPAYDGWTLDVAGPDERGHAAEVQARAAAAGIATRVRFPGAIAEADKAATFAATDLLVLPSFSENFGIVVSEALAHAVPVIATHGAPWSELPVERCGWWVAPDAASLAAALKEALALSPAARTAMGMRGRAWVGRTLAWDRIAEQTAMFYDWSLHGGHKPEFVDA